MPPHFEIMLDAPDLEGEVAEMEAVLNSLTQLGLIAAWRRRRDGAYGVEADPDCILRLSELKRPTDPCELLAAGGLH